MLTTFPLITFNSRVGILDTTSKDPTYMLKISGPQGSSWQEVSIKVGERGLFRPVFTATALGSTAYSSIAVDDISFLTCPGMMPTIRN